MANYGVIDLGSNTVRLVVYSVNGRRKPTGTSKDFTSLINDKVMAGLAAYVVDNTFTQAGIDRAVSVLKGHLKRAKYFDCKRVDIFATAVLRNCDNSAKAIAAIEKAIGSSITLLSARDEAHLGFVGATCDRRIERGTLIDIGGGSTELTRVRSNKDSDNVSVPMGSLSAYEQFVAYVAPHPEEAHAIEETFRQLLAQTLDAGKIEQSLYEADTFYAIGGSARAVAKMTAHLRHVPRPKSLTFEEVSAVLQLVEGDVSAYAHAAAVAVPERLHTLGPGCVILHESMQAFGATSLEICKYGVREGFLLERVLA